MAFLLFCMHVHVGRDIPDSLKTLLDSATTNSTRIRAHFWIANALTTTNYRKELWHATWSVNLPERTGDQSAMIQSYKLGLTHTEKELFDFLSEL